MSLGKTCGNVSMRFAVALALSFSLILSFLPLAKANAEEATVSLPLISTCAICDGSHGHISGADAVLSVPGAEDGATLEWSYTGSASVAEVREAIVSEGKASIDFAAISVGNTTFSFTLNGATVGTVSVQVYEAERDISYTAAEKIELDSLNIGSEIYQGEYLVSFRPDDGCITYGENDYLKLVNDGPISDGRGGLSWCGELYFAMGMKMPDAFGEKYQISVANEEIAKVVLNDAGEYRILPVAEGETTLTFDDVWNEPTTIPVVVKDFGEEAQKNYSLAEDELTIEVGEYFDLSDLVQGSANNSYFVFKTKNASIASVHNELNGKEAGIFLLLGRSPGDVVVTAGVLNDPAGDYGGGDQYANQMVTADFDQITIHVVERSSESLIPKAQVDPDSRTSAEVGVVDATPVYNEMIAGFKQEGVGLVVGSSDMSAEDMSSAIDRNDSSPIFAGLSQNGFSFVSLLDIRFEDGGGLTVPTDPGAAANPSMVVSVNLDSIGLDSNTRAKVFFTVKATGSAGDVVLCEEVDCWVEGDFLYFLAPHFSDYAIAAVEEPGDSDSSGVSGSEGDASTGGEGSSTVESSGALDASGNTAPKTGDISGGIALAFACIAVVAAIAVGYARLRDSSNCCR